MQIRIEFILVYIVRLIISERQSNDWHDILKYHLVEDLKPHEVVFYIDYFDNVRSLNLTNVIKVIAAAIPVVIIEMKNGLIFNDNNATLNIFMDYNNSSLNNHSNYIIDFFVQRQNLSMYRSKNLWISLSTELVLKEHFESSLKKAWSNNILDYSIIDIKLNSGVPILYHYNPFYSNFSRITLSIETTIFPKKLRNVNKYLFKVFVYNMEYLSVEKNETDVTSVKLHDDFFFPLLNISLTIINFDIKYVTGDDNSSTLRGLQESASKYLKMGNANALMLPMPLSLRLSETTHVVNEYETGRYVAIVPILSDRKLNLLFTICIELLMIILTVSICLYVLFLFKLVSQKFHFISIIRLVFGAVISGNLHKSRDRIIFISLIFMSMKYSTEFYSKFLGIKIINDEKAFDTISEIDNSNYQSYVNGRVFNVVFGNYENPSIKNIMKRTIKTENISTSCIIKLIDRSDLICILIDLNARAAVKKYLNKNGLPVMKIAKPAFASELMMIFFEKNSPYLDRIQQVFREIYEFGFWRKWYKMQEFNYFKKHLDTDITKNLMVTKFMIMLMIGYAFSLCILVAELMFKLLCLKFTFLRNLLKY